MLIAKSRNIKDYKNKSENDLIKILSEQPKPIENLSKKNIKKTNKGFNELTYGFSKSKINNFRRSLYNIQKQKNLSAPEIKETEKNLHELEKSLSSLKKHYDYDETKHRGIRNIENLFNENLLNRVALNKIEKDYYKPIKTKSAFNNNYIEYEYFDVISPYLSDMTDDHKTQSEWKIQLTVQISYISSKDSEETRTMHSNSCNIEIIKGNETDETIEKLF